MPHAKNDNVIALNVKNHAIITDAETVAAEFRISQPFGVLEWIVCKTDEGCTKTLFNSGIKPGNVSEDFCVYTSR